MMNNKDLERKMNEKITNIVMDLLKTGQLDDEIAEVLKVTSSEKSGTKPEKVSRAKKRHIGKLIDRIKDDESVLDLIGFAGFKDRSGFVFGNVGDNVFDILSLMIADLYEELYGDETDDVDFEDFLNDLINNARMVRVFNKRVEK